jgi:hypothetical protein
MLAKLVSVTEEKHAERDRTNKILKILLMQHKCESYSSRHYELGVMRVMRKQPAVIHCTALTALRELRNHISCKVDSKH